MSESKRMAKLLEEIKKGFVAPPDLQNNELILGPEVTPIIFTPLLGQERQCYEDEKLHYETSYTRKFTDDKGKKKSSFKIIRKYVSWIVQNDNGKTDGPFSPEEMVKKMNNGELNQSLVKRVQDVTPFVSFLEMKKELKKPFEDESEMDSFVKRIGLVKK
ncbi:hypothetical protein H311_02501 [Anncaliia algerae PRA109]|nr:hypothetical protein H311_02501 [Anncaliia algerae PRA109]